MSWGPDTRDWDAATYHRVSDIQFGWGVEALERLPLAGDETVLDAGCGSGRLTAVLEQRLPSGRVIAVDASASMVEQARATVDQATRVEPADLSELDLGEPVDAVFSNAVFHWIGDHDRLFRRLSRALRPGGRLIAQCGGEGNVDRFLATVESVAEAPPFDAAFAGFEGPWYFASAEATAERLLAAGFEQIDCWLEPRLVSPAEPEAFLATVCLGHHLERLPEDQRARFVERVASAAAPLELDYVRLNIDARRSA